jgi:branched-chain amino acid transport system permease protein
MRTALSVLRRSWSVTSLLVLVVGVALVGSLLDDSDQRTATLMLVNLVVVVGISMFVGNSGLFSFGHVAFMGVGAYAAAIATLPPALKAALFTGLPGWLADLHLSTPLALVAGGLLAAALAGAFSVPIMRLSGIAVGIATLALLVSTNVVIANWDAVTRGNAGLIGVPTDTTISTAVPWVLGAILVAAAYRTSRWGFRLRATRENDVAALALGIDVRRERRIAFVLSAFVCGIGGGLYTHFLGAAAPGDFFIDETVLTLLMLVVGGAESLAGAVVGTVFVSIVAEALRRVEDGGDLGLFHMAPRPGIQQVALALLLLATLLLRPRGLTGGREVSWPRRVAVSAPVIEADERPDPVGVT